MLLVAGASLVDEAPLAALAARQVSRRGGRVFVLNAGESYLADAATVTPVHPAKLASELAAITAKLGAEAADATGAIARALAAAKQPGILLGSDLLDGPAFTAAAELARAVKSRGTAPRLGFLFPGPNGFGAAALSRSATLPGILADLAAGKLKAVVLVECETSSWDASHVAALATLDQVIVLDHLAGPLHEAARTFLPTATTYESEGAFVNRAGRLQAFARSRATGIPVRNELVGSSFPRQYRTAADDSDVRAAWQVLEQLREATFGSAGTRDLAALRAVVARAHPYFAALREARAGSDGIVLDLSALTAPAASVPAFAAGSDGLAVFRTDRTLGSELLAQRSEPMRKMAGPPVARLSPADAKKLGVNGAIGITIAGRTVEMAARVHEGVPEGMLLVPRDAEWPATALQGAAAKVAAHAMA